MHNKKEKAAEKKTLTNVTWKYSISVISKWKYDNKDLGRITNVYAWLYVHMFVFLCLQMLCITNVYASLHYITM